MYIYVHKEELTVSMGISNMDTYCIYSQHKVFSFLYPYHKFLSIAATYMGVAVLLGLMSNIEVVERTLENFLQIYTKTIPICVRDLSVQEFKYL